MDYSVAAPAPLAAFHYPSFQPPAPRRLLRRVLLLDTQIRDPAYAARLLEASVRGVLDGVTRGHGVLALATIDVADSRSALVDLVEW
jgi:hypothetical protein